MQQARDTIHIRVRALMSAVRMFAAHDALTINYALTHTHTRKMYIRRLDQAQTITKQYELELNSL